MNSLDKNIVIALVMLACLPFDQVLQFNVGVAILSVVDVIQLYLLFILIILMITRGFQLYGSLLFFFTIFLFTSSLIISVAILGASIGDSIRQARFFFPFILATAICATKLRADNKIVLTWVAFAIGFSALWAIVLHLYYPAYLGRLFATSEELSLVVLDGGRMYWERGTLSFFVVAAFLLTKKMHVKLFFMMILVFFAIFLTQSRTLAIALFLYFLVGYLVIFKKPISLMIYSIFLLLFSGFAFLVAADEKMQQLFNTRFFGGDDFQSEFGRAFIVNRVTNYEQYFDIIKNSFPFGQGLGRPLSVTMFFDEIYTSDISFISFLLPFGIFGVILFLWFLIIIWRYFSSFKEAGHTSNFQKVFFIMVTTTLLLSLNLDIYSRNIFVIYLAFFASLYFQGLQDAMSKGVLHVKQYV